MIFIQNNQFLIKQEFIDKLKTISIQPWIFLSDIVELVTSLKVVIDVKILKSYLSKRSIFMNKVPGRVIKEFFIPFLSANNPKYFESLKEKFEKEDTEHNIKIAVTRSPSIKQK